MVKIIKYSITFIIFSIILSLFVLYFYLLKGISIQNINNPKLTISKLYIKIDKKIILKAKNINIKIKKENSNSTNFNETYKAIKKIVQFLSFFQEINIKNLNIDKNKINLISLKNNSFLVDNDDFFVKTNIFPENSRIVFKINKLYLKKRKITLKDINGNFYSDLVNLYVNIKNNYKNSDIKLHLKISNKKVSYDGRISNISNNTFKDFYQLPNNLKLNINTISFLGNLKKAKIYISDTNLNIKDKNISINISKIDSKYKIPQQNLTFFTNNISTKKDDISIISNSVNGNYQINSKNLNLSILSLNIEKNNTLIRTSNINLKSNLKNTLINIQNLSLKQKELSLNSGNLIINYSKFLKVYIPKTTIKTNKINTILNQSKISYDMNNSIKMLTNLNASYNKIKITADSLINYNLHNNTLQINSSNTLVNKLPINNFKLTLKNDLLNLNFKTNILLSKQLTSLLKEFKINIPIYQKNGSNKIDAKIAYNLSNKTLNTNLNIDINNSTLYINDKTKFDIKYSKLTLNNKSIFIKNSLLDFNQSNIYCSYLIKNGLIDLNNSKISINGLFKNLNIKNMLKLSNYPEKIAINIKGINIYLENLKTQISISKQKNINIKISKLSEFYPYVKTLQEYKITDGNINININDKILINTNLITKLPIFEKNLKPINKLSLKTIIKDNNITISNNNFNFKIKNNNPKIEIKGKLKNIDINITKFLETNSSKSSKNEKQDKNISAYITAENNTIIIKNSKLYSQKLTIDYNKSNLKFSSLYKDRNISIYQNNGNLKIYGLNIDSKTFKDLTNSTILNDPKLTFFALKLKESNLLQGFIDIHKGYIKELKAFNNVLAFINLIPSLVTFQAVGFSNKGYKIRKGHIEFILVNNILYLKEVDIKGENLSFNGIGYIDLNKKTINFNVNVNLLVKLIKDIPIVNYILLGNDGGITIKLTISGDLNNPKVDKNTASNIITIPVDIIQRTLLTPFRPFMKEEK